jgi:hypothetical protein
LSDDKALARGLEGAVGEPTAAKEAPVAGLQGLDDEGAEGGMLPFPFNKK